MSVNCQLIVNAAARQKNAAMGSRNALPRTIFTPLPMLAVSPTIRLIVSLVPLAAKKPTGICITCANVTRRSFDTATCTIFSARYDCENRPMQRAVVTKPITMMIKIIACCLLWTVWSRGKRATRRWPSAYRPALYAASRFVGSAVSRTVSYGSTPPAPSSRKNWTLISVSGGAVASSSRRIAALTFSCSPVRRCLPTPMILSPAFSPALAAQLSLSTSVTHR